MDFEFSDLVCKSIGHNLHRYKIAKVIVIIACVNVIFLTLR